MKLKDSTSLATVMPAHERFDPYWGGMWNVGSSATWYSRRSVERLIEQERLRSPAWMQDSIEKACEHIAYGTHCHDSLAALAAISCFRTLTVEQLACITGQPLFANHSSTLYGRLLASGFAQEGVIPTPTRSTIPRVIRPFATRNTDALYNLLNQDDLVGLTHGQEWMSGSMHDRHNVLAAELLLRLAEYTGIALSAGEQLAPLSLLTGVQSNRAGDGMFIRSDGATVVLEVTATVSSNFPSKVDNWVKALSANRDLSVLFVEVTHPDTAERSRSVFKTVRKEIHRGVSDVSARMSGVHERIMVARWADWFPAPGEVSPNFFSLTTERPTGRGDDVWQRVDLLDVFDFAPVPSGNAMLHNSNLLYGIPHWQQNGEAQLTLH